MGKNKNLSTDEIGYAINIETAEAQKEIYDLSKQIKKLSKEERERRRAMVELEAQGKKNTDEYRNLEAELKDYSKQIAENNKKIQEATKKMDVNVMTMVQLRKQAKFLRAEMDNMLKSLNPKEYAELEKQLGRVEGRMRDLRGASARMGKEVDVTANAMNKLKTMAKAFVMVTLVAWFKKVHDAAFETRKEFAKYEAVLSNTFQSQEKATEAMRDLQQMASNTPYSLQVWTEGYIQLVNRGLKPTTAEMTKIGDLASSQGKDIDQMIEAMLAAMTGQNERLKQFGISASKNGETTKFTFRGVTTEVRNTEQAIKDYLLSLGEIEGVAGSMAVQMKELEGLQSNLGDAMDSFWNNVGKKFESFWKKSLTSAINFVSDMSKALEPIEESFDAQLRKVVELEQEIPIMASRYEELAGKINRNADEQAELNTLMEKISNIVPSAVAEWDQYGNIISLNTDRVYEYMAAEKARLNYINKEEIRSLKKRKSSAEKELKSLMALDKKRMVWAGEAASSYTDTGGFRPMSENEIASNQEKIKEMRDELLGVTAQLDKVSGYDMEKIVQDRIDAQAAEVAARDKFNAMNKAQLDAWLKDEKNASDKYKEIAQTIYRSRFQEQDPDKVKKAAEKQAAATEKEQRARVATEKEAVKSLENLRTDELATLQKFYNDSLAALNQAQADGSITKEQHDMMVLQLEKENTEARLQLEKNYYDDAQSMALADAETKEDIVRKSNQRVLDAEKAANAAQIAQQKAVNDLVKDFKSQFKVTTVDEDYQAQLVVLEASYQARKELAIKNNQDTTELDKAYFAAKEQLEQEHENKIQAMRNQYGLATQQERFDAELLQLQNARKQQLLTEEEYEKAVQNLKRDSYKQQFDYFSDLFAGAVSALQQAEMDNLDAKYDAEIEAAKGNAEEVERLENEKAQKKLDIEKKYADVNFAIKASQIIADTSVSIMKALAELGPIAGPIAAGMMGITGAAQLASAVAERNKIKNMTLSGSNSSSGKGARVATGRESGGKIDVQREQDGKLFRGADYSPGARGFIDKPTVIVGEGPHGQSKEWVASNAAVSNPTVAPLLDILDQAQQAGTIRTLDMNQAIKARMAGYASGGSISKPSTSTPSGSSPGQSSAMADAVLNRLTDAIKSLEDNGVQASVNLTEFERKQELRDKARNKAKKR